MTEYQTIIGEQHVRITQLEKLSTDLIGADFVKTCRLKRAEDDRGALLEACRFALECIEEYTPELSDGSMGMKLRAAIERVERP